MNAKKILIGVMALAMVLPILNSPNKVLTNDSVVSADEETINGLNSNEYENTVNSVICLLNEYRVSNGLQPVKTSPLMQEMAKQRAKEMEQTDLSHNRPDGSVCFTIFDENNVVRGLGGENVAKGQDSPESVMDSWKNSEYHNANMINPDFTHVGVGVTYYEGVYYWVELLCSTEDEKIVSEEYFPTVDTTNTDTDYNFDVNNDDDVNVLDLLLEKKAILNIESVETYNYDINNDDSINVLDLLLIKKEILKVLD